MLKIFFLFQPIHDLIAGKTDTATVGNIQITYRQQQISIQLPPVGESSENGVIAADESRPAISSLEHWSDVEERLVNALDEFLQ